MILRPDAELTPVNKALCWKGDNHPDHSSVLWRREMTTRNTVSFVLFALAVTACGQPSQEGAVAPAQSLRAPFALAGDAERGAPLFQRHCASCHGVEGRGDGVTARAIRPAPTDFTRVRLSEEHTYAVTRGGGMAGGKAPTMPPFERAMSDQELRDVVAYTLSLYGE
jgi:mono/diheme cytochrome c family protein